MKVGHAALGARRGLPPCRPRLRPMHSAACHVVQGLPTPPASLCVAPCKSCCARSAQRTRVHALSALPSWPPTHTPTLCPLQHIPGLSPTDIASLVSGYAALQHSPGVVLFDSLAAAAAQRGEDFTAEQRAAVAAAYEALGYRDKSPF